MSGSLSQPHAKQPMSLIHSFRNEDMYSPQYSEDMYQNTARKDTLVEVMAPQLTLAQPKPSRRRQKRMTKVLQYLCNKTKQPGRRTYDMVNGKWKTVRSNVARFCGVHANVMRRAQSNHSFRVPYVDQEVLNFLTNQNAAERSKTSGSRDKAKGLKKKGAGSLGSSLSMNDEALARLMVSELVTQIESTMAIKKEECATFLEIKMRGWHVVNES
nr:hypothetical protein [Tanacetum cinerariifolium]